MAETFSFHIAFLHGQHKLFLSLLSIRPLLDRSAFDHILAWWASRKYKKTERILKHQPPLFAHWQLLQSAAGRLEPDELRGSCPALREREGKFPRATRRRTAEVIFK